VTTTDDRGDHENDPGPGDEAFRPHDLEWNDARIARFWDLAPEQDYFSSQVGESLANWIRRNASPKSPVVDVGCGRGDLLAYFQRRGYEVLGTDVSPDNLKAAGQLLGGRVQMGFAAATGLPDHYAGAVLLVETLEHLLDVEPALNEIGRILAPGAPLVVTTPNAEVLDRNKITCPECGSRFHKVQHVRSWTPSSLASALRDAGFRDVMTATLQLAPGHGWIRRYREIKLGMQSERQHLVAIARNFVPSA
jgi:SAM-dependent methyltransferase